MAENNSKDQPAESGKSSDQAAAQPGSGVVFATKRIYLKDMSYEAPLGHEAFAPRQGQPKISQDLNTQVDRIADDLYEVVLKLTVTLKLADDKTLFLAEVHQAGIFEIKGVPAQQLQPILTAACPQILFPYIREAIDTLAVRGGFPPLYLPHINFDALYAQAVAEARAKSQAENTEASTS